MSDGKSLHIKARRPTAESLKARSKNKQAIGGRGPRSLSWTAGVQRSISIHRPIR